MYLVFAEGLYKLFRISEVVGSSNAGILAFSTLAFNTLGFSAVVSATVDECVTVDGGEWERVLDEGGDWETVDTSFFEAVVTFSILLLNGFTIGVDKNSFCFIRRESVDASYVG